MEPLSATDPVVVGGVRLFARLGSGGFGQVFLGRNRLQEWVAVKVLHPSAISGDGLQRFAREARATARVDSDFLAAVQEISISGDPAFIVSQFIPGPTLAEGVTRPGQITGPEIEALAVGLLAAMDQLAAAGVTHRDIKPANIILGEQGPVLVDLGIAKSDTETTLTVAGAVAGTPSWMAPEQATGTDVGPPADVWAWGRCLTWITQQPGSAPLPDALSPWVTQALSDTPASRPTAASLLDALAPDGAKDFVSARWGRLGGYAVGRRDALTDMLQNPPTLLDDSGNEPTRRYSAGAGQGVTPAHAPVTPTPSPPIIVQAPPARSQAALITAIVVVGVLLIAGIAGAAYFLRPTTQPAATQTVQAPAASPAPTVTVSTKPRPAPTKTITATSAPQPIEDEIASGPATEQETMQSIMDYMNAGRWDLIPSLCNPESVCYTQLIDFFQKRFESGQFIRGAVGPLRPCYDVPSAWVTACDSPQTWLAEFSWTCSKDGSTGTQTEVGKLNFDYAYGPRLSWFDGTRNTPRIGAWQCG